MDVNTLMRKLQPVYSALESGDYRSAIKHCEKKDVLDTDLALVLKSYAIERKAFSEIVQRTTGSFDYEQQESRIEKLHEAWKIVKMVLARTNLSNDRVTHLAGLVLRNLGKYRELIAMYEKISTIIQDEDQRAESMEHMFCWSLRLDDYDNMTKLGMAMSKTFANEKYLGWSAVSLFWDAILLSQKASDQDEQVLRKLSIAEMLLRKLVASRPIVDSPTDATASSGGNPISEGLDEDDPDAHGYANSDKVFNENVRALLAQVLLLENKKAEAISFVSSELKNMEDSERLRLLAEIHMRECGEEASQDDLKLAAGFFKELLLNHDPEDWRNWSGLLEAWTSLGRSENLEDFIESVRTKAEDANPKLRLRGPRLAKIHLHLRNAMADSNASPQVANAVIEYLEEFGSKACCFGDLRNVLLFMVPDMSNGVLLKARSDKWPPQQPPGTPMVWMARKLGVPSMSEQLANKRSYRWPVEEFATLFCGDVREKVLDFIKAQLPKSEALATDEDADVQDRKKALRTAITYLQVSRFLGAWEKDNESTLVERADRLVGVYRATILLDEGAQGGQREVKVGDDLSILVAHIMVDLCNREPGGEHSKRGRMWLFVAASVLEQAYAHSSAGFQLALLLIEIYGRLDMNQRIFELYTKLDVKHIQIDSLSHLVLGGCIRSAAFVEAKQCCSNLQVLWKASRYNNVNDFRRALHQGNLVHAGEFLRLDRRLLRSHQRIIAVAESMTIDILGEGLDSWERLKKSLLDEVAVPDQDAPDIKTRICDLLATEDTSNLLSHQGEGLALNYDFSVQVSWDFPLGASSVFEMNRLAKRSVPLAGQSRVCTSLVAYDDLWLSRSKLWLELRVLQAKIARKVLLNDFEMKFIDGDWSRFIEIVDRLSLASTDEDDAVSEGSITNKLLWKCCVSGAKAALKLLDEPITSLEEAGRLKIVDYFETHLEHLNAVADIQEDLDSKTIQVLSDAYSQELFWIGVYLRACMDVLPKKKNKKKNDSDDTIRKAIKTCATSWSKIITNFQDKLVQSKVIESECDSPQSPLATVSTEQIHSVTKSYVKNRAAVIDTLNSDLKKLLNIVKSAKY